MKEKWVFFEDSWNEHEEIQMRKTKRIKDEFNQRSKIKNNRGGTPSS